MDDAEENLELVLPATEMHYKKAIGALQDGKVIAVPTDTLYGLACDACSSEAVGKIYEIKERDSTSPLAICVGDIADIKYFAAMAHLPDGLLDKLLPGPVTIILSRDDSSKGVKSLNPDWSTIGIRVPDCKFIREIAREMGVIALTSANLSGQQSSIDINDFREIWKYCAFIFDGGMLNNGRGGSTIVDLTAPGECIIRRPGSAKEQTLSILATYSFQETTRLEAEDNS